MLLVPGALLRSRGLQRVDRSFASRRPVEGRVGMSTVAEEEGHFDHLEFRH